MSCATEIWIPSLFFFVFFLGGEGGGGGRVPNKVLYGEVLPRGPNPFILYAISGDKRYPFLVPSIDNGTLFTYLPARCFKNFSFRP